MTTVVVVSPYQVCLNGTVHPPGDRVEAPDDVAKTWLAHGWVQKPKAAPARKPGTKRKDG